MKHPALVAILLVNWTILSPAGTAVIPAGKEAALDGPTRSDDSVPLVFEGRINATLKRGEETQTFLYTISKNDLRIERGETDRPHARNIISRATGGITLLFPHNRSFVRLKEETTNRSATPAGFPAMPALPPGIGPQSMSGNLPQSAAAPISPAMIRPTNVSGVPALPEMPKMPAMPPGIDRQSTPGNTPQAFSTLPAPASIGPTNLPGAPAVPQMPAMPALPSMPSGVGPQSQLPAMPGMGGMPAMPMMPMGLESIELKSTGEKQKRFGLDCEKYEIKSHGEVLEIWATSELLPFEPYQQNQAPRFGPRMIEDQWGGMLKAKKLFPLLAVMKLQNGPERWRYEVKSIKAEKTEDKDGALFLPPADYHELDPLPF